jgi:hypothetical protein
MSFGAEFINSAPFLFVSPKRPRNYYVIAWMLPGLYGLPKLKRIGKLGFDSLLLKLFLKPTHEKAVANYAVTSA